MARAPSRAKPEVAKRQPVRPLRWYQQARWSVLTVLALVAILCAVGAKLAFDVGDALPAVGKDAQGNDPWTDPIGVEKVGDFAVAHVPDCAAGPIVRIMLWDDDSNPYWQVSGPPTPMSSFPLGATPAGFTVDTPYRPPPPETTMRLIIIRTVGGAAGVRFRGDDIRSKRIVSMLPLTRFTIAGFQTADVCGDDGKAKKPGDEVTTSTPSVAGG